MSTRVTHICVGNLTISGSDNSLSPDRRQAIILTNAGILLIVPIGTNFSDNLIKIHTFSFKKIQENAFENVVWKMSAILSRPQCVNITKDVCLPVCILSQGNRKYHNQNTWVRCFAQWTHSSRKTSHTCFVFNPLRGKFFRGNINIYFHFVSFLRIDMTQVLKILPQVREGPIYSVYSISWLLMTWRRKEPGHQQPWYWPS